MIENPTGNWQAINDSIDDADLSESSSPDYSENEYEEIGSGDSPDLTRVSIYQNPMPHDDIIDAPPVPLQNDIVDASPVVPEDDIATDDLPQIPDGVIESSSLIHDATSVSSVTNNDATSASEDDATSHSGDDVTSSDESDNFDIISIPPPPGIQFHVNISVITLIN